MSGFSLRLCSATRREQFDDVVHFVGADASGQFGLLPGHCRLITVLRYGLARFQIGGDWHHLALPGAVLTFDDNQLRITSRRYIHGMDEAQVEQSLGTELRAEEARLSALKDHLGQLEQSMFRTLWQMERG